MYTGLLHVHGLLRYFILILPVIIIIRLLMHRDTFRNRDKQLTLWLMIVAHTQLLVGIGLFFLSPYVQLNAMTMKVPELRYWAVEHSSAMIVVVVLITLARVQSRKPIGDAVKRKRVLILLIAALLIAVAVLYMSGRGVLIPT